jgi:LAS superfamily LD-carboxypeptidase LdcB
MLLLLGGFSGCSAQSQECEETVVIDSIEYRVPPRWCGKAIDSARIPDPATLVRLPDELSFEDSRIYVRRETRDAFVRMAEAARKDSVELITDSGFRSASFQRKIIRRRLAEGASFEEVVRFAAPPGYSEHETGLVVDLVPSEARFAHTPIYEWLTQHAQTYGFVESLPEDSTGEAFWESWHWRFDGVADTIPPAPLMDLQ